jgi:hypothetical protein
MQTSQPFVLKCVEIRIKGVGMNAASLGNDPSLEPELLAGQGCEHIFFPHSVASLNFCR